tara:strand:- start:107 stop:676 length:570 start_codon:yes stop_codon:yes gene_type:complete
MPINFDIEELRLTYNCKNYFETGLFDPRCNVSVKQALKCNFNKVFSIEIRDDWVNLGKEIFKEDIQNGRLNLYLDDSANMEKYLTSDDFNNKTIFFLDAHIDNDNIHNYKNRCPLLDELSAIKNLERKDNIILVDDLRIVKERFPWNERSYGDIDFFESIKNLILSINKDYKFSTLNGVIDDDVLLAYI